MPIALTCPWCGAPLPAVLGQPFVRCAYCDATASLSGAFATKAEAGAAAPKAAVTDATSQKRVIDAFQAARERGAAPYEALVAAAQERLGPLGQTDAFARVCLALAADFDAENGTSVVDDPIGMSRMVEVYLRAIEAVRAEGRFEVSLPFFATTDTGPKHFSRTLTVADIAALAAREPPTPKPKKRGFWPFR
jgi:hypothetical protein